jgi:hypothetical protein
MSTTLRKTSCEASGADIDVPLFTPVVPARSFLTSSSQQKNPVSDAIRRRRRCVCLRQPTKGDKVMKSIWRFSLCKVLLLVIAAMSVSAIPAHAQTTSGKFSLAHKVRWGSAVLAAGDYAFSVDVQEFPTRVTVRQLDGSMVAMFMPQSVADDDLVGASSLVLHDENGESVVSILRLKSVGLALKFASPKLSPQVAETAGLGPIAASQPAK